MKFFSHFLLKFFKFNYQLQRKQLDQSTSVFFPKVLTRAELQQFIIKDYFKYFLHKNPEFSHILYFGSITLDNGFRVEQSETSDSRQ